MQVEIFKPKGEGLRMRNLSSNNEQEETLISASAPKDPYQPAGSTEAQVAS